MTDDVDLSISQFRDAWRVICAPCPGAVFGSSEGVEFLFSGLPIGFFNVAIVTDRGLSAHGLQARARAARDWASDKGVPWLFLVTHEALGPGVVANVSLEPSGLAPVLPLTGMVTDRVPQASVPEGLSLVMPPDEAGYGAFFDLNGAAYGMDLSACKPVHAQPSFWAGHVGVVGLAEGRPVTCAAVLMAGGYRYVAMVATEPAAQKRGYAAAAMLHALDVAVREHGDRPTFLHATEAGRAIYARMGYERVSTHTAYLEVGPGDTPSAG